MHFILTQLHKCIICCKHICVLKKRSTWILNKYMVCGYAMLCAYVHFLHINILIVSLNIYLWILLPIMPAKILFFAFLNSHVHFAFVFIFCLTCCRQLFIDYQHGWLKGMHLKCINLYIYCLEIFLWSTENYNESVENTKCAGSNIKFN